ncbi:MAG: hypothetical protein EXQ69_06405 [Acidimicrobiia bacterium]|nr:hypothetical protein [Acidimicrobiia bacterium]
MATTRLSPAEIARQLLGISPDRDERASQLCAETLLTLIANAYAAPKPGKLRSPKKRQFAIRSLVTGTNFLDKREEARIGSGQFSVVSYGQALAAGSDFGASENLALAKAALEGLIDPQTRRGQAGTWLLYPFAEELLWYDARQTQGRPWDVRKVYMRGSGITLARLLLNPSSGAARQHGKRAVAALRDALQDRSQVAHIASHLEAPLAGLDRAIDTEPDEVEAWDSGDSEDLQPLANALCAHAASIMGQSGVGSTAKLWRFRNLLGVNLAVHTAQRAWAATGTPEDERYLLLSVGGPERHANNVRQRSEECYQSVRTRIREAIIRTLADGMQELAKRERRTIDWAAEFEARSNLERVAEQLPKARTYQDYEIQARHAFEQAAYGRPIDGFRVLLESVGMVRGHSGWRYLTATPDLMGAFIGALSDRMPMPSREFFEHLFKQWRIVLSPEIASRTSLLKRLDGSELARNARRVERLLVEAGLAVSLSDSTTIVGGSLGVGL